MNDWNDINSSESNAAQGSGSEVLNARAQKQAGTGDGQNQTSTRQSNTNAGSIHWLHHGSTIPDTEVGYNLLYQNCVNYNERIYPQLQESHQCGPCQENVLAATQFFELQQKIRHLEEQLKLSKLENQKLQDDLGKYLFREDRERRRRRLFGGAASLHEPGSNAHEVFTEVPVTGFPGSFGEAELTCDFNSNLQASYFASRHHDSQSQQDSSPVLTPGRPLSTTAEDWERQGARPRQVQRKPMSAVLGGGIATDVSANHPGDESSHFVGKIEGIEHTRGEEEGGKKDAPETKRLTQLQRDTMEGNEIEDGISYAFLAKHSEDEALRASARKALKQEGSVHTQQLLIGSKLPSQNCVKCNKCIDPETQESHLCEPEFCCICQQDLDAFIDCHELACSHKFHEVCVIGLFHNDFLKCPLCSGPL